MQFPPPESKMGKATREHSKEELVETVEFLSAVVVERVLRDY